MCDTISSEDSLFLFSIINDLVCLSGTGALAIFLQKTFRVDITTCDYDDKDIEENIAHNCRVNKLDVLPHIRRKENHVLIQCIVNVYT